MVILKICFLVRIASIGSIATEKEGNTDINLEAPWARGDGIW